MYIIKYLRRGEIKDKQLKTFNDYDSIADNKEIYSLTEV